MDFLQDLRGHRKDIIQFSLVFIFSVAVSLLLTYTFIAPQFTAAKAKETLESEILSAKATVNSPAINIGSNELIADIVEDVSSSVVLISTEREVEIQSFGLSGSFFEDDFFQHFFGVPQFKNKHGVPYKQEGTGSGFIISSDGFILTNYHVVKDATKITVKTNDEKEYIGKLIGKDKYSDLAVIKIDKNNLKPVKLADSSKIRPGQWAIAVGSPHGLNNTVTLGIISAVKRNVPQLSNVSFIQTDAAINPGNSGGPLLNIKGEVVGINTAIIGHAQNIGFAVPINTAKSVVEQLKKGKTIGHPWIGIAMSELTDELAKALGVAKGTKGVVIGKIMPDSPAFKSGLQQGDIIQRIDGKTYTSSKDIQDYIKSKKVGNTVNVQILRDGLMVGKKVKLGIWGGED